MYSLEYSHRGDSFVTLNIPKLENWNDIPKLLPFASRRYNNWQNKILTQ